MVPKVELNSTNYVVLPSIKKYNEKSQIYNYKVPKLYQIVHNVYQ